MIVIAAMAEGVRAEVVDIVAMWTLMDAVVQNPLSDVGVVHVPPPVQTKNAGQMAAVAHAGRVMGKHILQVAATLAHACSTKQLSRQR